MRMILDASAFLSGMIVTTMSDKMEMVTTHLVELEVKNGSPKRLLGNLKEAGLKVIDPIDTASAVDAARTTGDLDRLSKADISVIALAMESEGSVVMTDDFRVQNVLGSLGLRYEPAGEVGSRTIRGIWTWTHRCLGCGRYFEEAQKNDECPVCGSPVRMKRKG
jgi:UPF0271 protein